MPTLVSVEAVSARHPARRPPPFPGCAVWWVVPACSQHSGEGVLCPGPRRAELQHPEHTVCEFSAWLTRTRPVLWVIIQRYLVLPICSSNRSSLGHRTPFQLAPVSLCHTPLVGFSSLSTSLLFCSTRWSWRDLYVSCPSLRISHCSKSRGSSSGDGAGNQDLGARHACHFWAGRPREYTRVNTCGSVHTCSCKQVCM